MFPSSPADLAGVKVDDQVLRIDEQETRLLSKEGMSALLHQSAGKGQVCLMLMRPTSGGPQSLLPSNKREEDSRKSVLLEGPGAPTLTSTPAHPPKRLPPVTVANYETGEKHTDSLFAKAAVVCFVFMHVCLPSRFLPPQALLFTPTSSRSTPLAARSSDA